LVRWMPNAGVAEKRLIRRAVGWSWLLGSCYFRVLMLETYETQVLLMARRLLPVCEMSG